MHHGDKIMFLTIDTEAPPLHADQHGIVYVGGTRVTLDSIVWTFLQGSTAESIAEAFPSVSLYDVYARIGYYLKHSEQVDAYLAERKQASEQVRAQAVSSPEYKLWRERLLERAKDRGLRP